MWMAGLAVIASTRHGSSVPRPGPGEPRDVVVVVFSPLTRRSDRVGWWDIFACIDESVCRVWMDLCFCERLFQERLVVTGLIVTRRTQAWTRDNVAGAFADVVQDPFVARHSQAQRSRQRCEVVP